MHEWIGSVLAQIMACRLFDAKPLFKPMLGFCFCQMDPWGQTFNQNTKLFIHENASENVVCEMAAILSRGGWVSSYIQVLIQVFQTTSPPREVASWESCCFPYLWLFYSTHSWHMGVSNVIGTKRNIVCWRHDMETLSALFGYLCWKSACPQKGW